jgi:hypothetical protein
VRCVGDISGLEGRPVPFLLDGVRPLLVASQCFSLSSELESAWRFPPRRASGMALHSLLISLVIFTFFSLFFSTRTRSTGTGPFPNSGRVLRAASVSSWFRQVELFLKDCHAKKRETGKGKKKKKKKEKRKIHRRENTYVQIVRSIRGRKGPQKRKKKRRSLSKRDQNSWTGLVIRHTPYYE